MDNYWTRSSTCFLHTTTLIKLVLRCSSYQQSPQNNHVQGRYSSTRRRGTAQTTKDRRKRNLRYQQSPWTLLERYLPSCNHGERNSVLPPFPLPFPYAPHHMKPKLQHLSALIGLSMGVYYTRIYTLKEKSHQALLSTRRIQSFFRQESQDK